MKKLFTLMFLAFAITSIQAQVVDASKVPAEVKTTFAKEFPNSNPPRWILNGDNYEAVFKNDGKSSTAYIDKKGKMLGHGSVIKTSELPEAALQYVTKNVGQSMPRTAEQLTRTNGDVFYKLNIGGKQLMLDAKGNVVMPSME